MRRFISILTLTIVLLVCTSAFSAPTLDQYYQGDFNETRGGSEGSAQTFTAGLSGKLDHVEVGMTINGELSWPVIVFIRTTGTALISRR